MQLSQITEAGNSAHATARAAFRSPAAVKENGHATKLTVAVVAPGSSKGAAGRADGEPITDNKRTGRNPDTQKGATLDDAAFQDSPTQTASR
jgi:hypothetical protein